MFVISYYMLANIFLFQNVFKYEIVNVTYTYLNVEI
jgi:hypothetical protein